MRVNAPGMAAGCEVSTSLAAAQLRRGQDTGVKDVEHVAVLARADALTLTVTV